MKIVLSVIPQVFARQFARAPRRIERMAEQVIFRDAGIQLCEKFLSSHFASVGKVHTTRNKPVLAIPDAFRIRELDIAGREEFPNQRSM
jgi:hypothetical protein